MTIKPSLKFVIVGNPENRRVSGFQAALHKFDQPLADVVSWKELLSSDAGLARFQSLIGDETVVRLDSPGEDPDVEQLLIAHGIECAGGSLSGHEIGSAPEADSEILSNRLVDRGEIRGLQQWYAGFSLWLNRLSSTVDDLQTTTRWMNSPDDITQMFHKLDCQQRMHDAGVPTPGLLGRISSYSHLRALMREANVGRVFLKLMHGSSASGVIALQVRAAGVHARTSVEVATVDGEQRLYNSLKLQTYANEGELALIVDQLSGEGMYAEEWLPKAGFENKTVDLRIVVIAGQAAHRVLRSSRGPITNLHLGNARGNIDAFWQSLPDSTQADIISTCERLGQLFPGSNYFGVDLLVSPGLRQHSVLEVNAFGDLLPGLLHRGRDTYEAELLALIDDLQDHP